MVDDNKIDVDMLVGREFGFFGVADNVMKLDDEIYEVVEDENDGYRSSMDYVRQLPSADGRPFFARELDRVRVTKLSDDYFDCWCLVGLYDGHVWLTFGTSNIGDYYPGFVFTYQPKPGVTDGVTNRSSAGRK